VIIGIFVHKSNTLTTFDLTVNHYKFFEPTWQLELRETAILVANLGPSSYIIVTESVQTPYSHKLYTRRGQTRPSSHAISDENRLSIRKPSRRFQLSPTLVRILAALIALKSHVILVHTGDGKHSS
jgi:hypothetical protein